MPAPSTTGSNGPPQSSSAPSRRRRLGQLVGSERGTAVVEFALVAPILFLLVFGILDFGRALNYYNDITQLAGQGARAAAVNRNPDGTAISAAAGTVDDADCGGKQYSIQCQLAKYYPTTPELKSGIHVCIPQAPTATGQPVTVHVTYDFNFSDGLFGFTTISLSSTQTERAEAIPASDYSGDETGAACS
ncbi:MAG TPA: TadE/TadG family type IV pilus assembly protein [Gaiellaceae bacterium]